MYAGLETKIKDLIVDELISVKSPDLKYHIKFLSIIKNMIGARAEPFWIFTTNYDMLFETAAMHVELPIRNGFEGCCARYFDMQRMKLKTGTLTRHSPGASRFEEHKEPYAKLIKLHGSISWYKNDKNTYELFGDNSIGSEYQRVLIHPQNYKVTQTLDSPYDKLFQYSGEVLGNRCNYLVTCGYSYRDQHINDRLLIPKLKTGKLRIFALFEQEPENIEDFKKHSAFNYLTKDKLYMNKKECAHPNDLWKFSKLVDFLSRHGAILGQTGSGKSWTVASFLQKIAEFEKSTVVLFDLHGEYKNAFENYADYIDASDLELPYWLMNSEELLDLMIDRSESSAPNQNAKFKELLQEEKQNHSENINLGIPKINVDTPVYFDFTAIINEFRRLDTEQVQGSTKLVKGPLNGQFTRLLMRIDSRLNDIRYDLIFKPKKYNTSASMTDLFKRILGEETNPKKLVIIDMSPIPLDVRNSIISLIMRCLFDFAYWYKRLNDKTYPISIFCDEAHIYLNDSDASCKAPKESAERIAKEGRKYGISLTVISQRPREVSSTILSQCNTFLCLRISNPDDQSYVKRLLPDSVAGVVSMFSALRRGESILLGDSVIMPTRIKIDIPSPRPSSDDCSFTKEWSLPHEDIEVEKVLNAWRRQSID